MFKIIMPVYNAEEYLEKAVDSIINQTLSFKDNVVINLIDDSSSDGSLELCNKYKIYHHRKFLNIYKLNGGFCYGSKSKLF